MSAPSAGGGGRSNQLTVAAVVGAAAVALGIGGFYLARGGGGGSGSGSGGGAAGGAATAAAATSANSASSFARGVSPEVVTAGGPSPSPSDPRAKLLAKLNSTLAALKREGPADSGCESASSARSSSSSRAGGHNSIERVVRDIRSKRWRKHLAHVDLLCRLRMAQVLLLYQRTYARRVSSSLILTADLLAGKEQQQRADYEMCWAMLHSHVGEAREEVTDPDAHEEALAASPPPPAADAPPHPHQHPFATAPFPPSTERGDVQRVLLEVALELADTKKMWLALRQILAVADPPSAASDAAAASASAALSPPTGGVSSGVPVVVSPARLLSLDYASLYTAFHVASMLGCWLWAYQLAHRLFGAARAATAASTHAHEPLYEYLHASALEAPTGLVIDLAVVSELATLRMQDTLARFPSLLERMQIRPQQIAPSVLPFDEEGRVIEAAAAVASPSPPSPLRAALLQPLPEAGVHPPACAWESWEVCAYSTVVRAVVSPDEAGGRASVLEQLEAAQDESPVHRCASLLGQLSNMPDEQGLPPGPARRILRMGRIFTMTGLFQQPIPTVGTILAEPHTPTLPSATTQASSFDAHSQSHPHLLPGTSFSLQGYTLVAPRTPAHDDPAALNDCFTQFEYYKLTAGNELHRSHSSASCHGITNSMVDAQAAAGGDGMSSPILSTLSSLDSAGRTRTPPESPPSAHLFASASFASLASSGLLHEHFPPPRRTPSPDALDGDGGITMHPHWASPSGSSSGHLPAPSSSHPSPSTPEPWQALDRYAASLPTGSYEIWQGLYRVIQEPRPAANPAAAAAALAAGITPRPRVEVHYDLRLLVARENPDAAPQQQFPQLPPQRTAGSALLQRFYPE